MINCLSNKIIKRFLNLHEHQASALLAKYNVPVLRGEAAFTSNEAFNIAKNIKSSNPNALGFVLKAQVHAGGRGRGSFLNSKVQGGVQILQTEEEVKDYSFKMIGDTLVTKQTGAKGKPCNRVYVVEKVKVEKEMYVCIMLNRNIGKPVLIVSAKGGMGIEEIGKEYIFTYEINPETGISGSVNLEEVCDKLEIKESNNRKIMKEALKGLYNCFVENDSTMIEINPFAVTSENELLVCDSKVNIDDNSKFRNKELFEQEDLTQKDPKEVKAEALDLNYIKLDGSIGCLVNGAGLAMATMDLIKYYGGSPANFLDVGGTSDTKRVTEAIKIIIDDKDVKSLFVNIFGGIVRCDIIISGIINAVKECDIKIPIVCRIKGTNSEEAKRLATESKLNVHWVEDLEEAAKKSISLIN